MMRRRRRRTLDDMGTLDSFLDVVCNLIGGLLLIALIAALSTENQVFDVFTPVERELKGSLPLIFAATENGIYPVHYRKALDKIKAKLESDRSRLSVKTDSEYFTWGLITNKNETVIIAQFKESSPPITDKDISRILLEMEKLKAENRNPKKFFAFFYVAPSNKAFRHYRLARKVLWDASIDVGWSPRDARKGLMWGKGGRTMKVQ